MKSRLAATAACLVALSCGPGEVASPEAEAAAAAPRARPAGPAGPREQVTGVLVTGRTMDVNGQTEVPAGLFGFHAVKLDPEMIREWGVGCYRKIHHGPDLRKPTVVKGHPQYDGLGMLIDCMGDRYHPAVVLTDRDFRKYFTDMGREYAEACARSGQTCYVEFWNEPFLNWAVKPGVNYDPRFYEAGEAEEGKPMRIRGWEKPLDHLVWSKQVRTVEAESGRTSMRAYLAHAYVGKDRKEGEEFKWGGRRYRNVRMWWGKDVTQKSWYSGRQNGQFYDWMLLPFAKAVKETNPRVKVIAGWNFNIDLDGWHMWRTLTKPTIDKAIRYLDGIDEHHYYVGALKIPGWYEVVVAYTVTEHGKRVKMYNTECGGYADTQLPGNEHLAGDKDPLRKAARVFTYHVREIVNLVHKSPDKAASRCKHGEPQKDVPLSGEEACFRLLRDLRGRLVETRTADPRVWPVASLNGKSLVVVAFNDHGDEVKLPFEVRAPRGTRLAGGRKTWVEVDGAKRTLKLVEELVEELVDTPVAASDRSYSGTLTLPGRSAAKYVFALEGEPAAGARLVRRQFFAKGILSKVEPGKPVTLAVEIDPAALAHGTHARLKLVLEDVKDGEGKASVNGAEVALPDADQVLYVPVALTDLKPGTAITFDCAGEKADGYQVNMASVEVDSVRE